uniref:ZZ-type domain-containing protein n=1 Tax=Globodera rostochiensis TaxID=31243 RepID=A0A914H1X4_GLORO
MTPFLHNPTGHFVRRVFCLPTTNEKLIEPASESLYNAIRDGEMEDEKYFWVYCSERPTPKLHKLYTNLRYHSTSLEMVKTTTLSQTRQKDAPPSSNSAACFGFLDIKNENESTDGDVDVNDQTNSSMTNGIGAQDGNDHSEMASDARGSYNLRLKITQMERQLKDVDQLKNNLSKLATENRALHAEVVKLGHLVDGVKENGSHQPRQSESNVEQKKPDEIPSKLPGDKLPHPDIWCDLCEKRVVGVRYKCFVCPDFDLCEQCEKTGTHAKHPMCRLATADTPMFMVQPSNRWNFNDCHQELFLDQPNFLIVQHRALEKGFRTVRAELAVPNESGIFYYEVKIEVHRGGFLGIGLATKSLRLDKCVGQHANNTYAYGSDGTFWGHNVKGCELGIVVGCGLNMATRQIIYTRNGQRLDTAELLVSPSKLYACVTLSEPGDVIEANFGPKFKFNIAEEFEVAELRK